ncbi:MAG: GTPase, partial [Myxococcota bacterium]
RFPKEREAIITDTVGFIRDLPPDLIRAFRATLEELEGADLLLHVVDIADPQRDDKIHAVQSLLEELHLGTIPILLVFNKCDRMEDWEADALIRKHQAVGISATKNRGIKHLVDMIAHKLWQNEVLSENNVWAAGARQDVFGPPSPPPDIANA